MNATIRVTDLATPAANAVIAAMGNRKRLNERIAVRAEHVTRTYILAIGAGRHKTATRLGATPTGALLKTAVRVTSSSTESSAVVEVPRFLFRRAFESFWIVPVVANYLTIALNKASYGRRAGELVRQGWKLFSPLRKGVKAIASRIDRKKADGSTNRRSKIYGPGDRKPLLFGIRPGDTKPTLLYALKTEVWAEQDRTLLPSNETYLAEARRAAAEYATQLLGTTGAAT